MKKSTVAVGVIIALGVVWTGGAWYSGKQLESKVDVVAKKMSAEASNKLGVPVHATIKDYKRSLFSTHFILDITSDKGSEISGIKLDKVLSLNVDVDHGPFPLARISSGNILPAPATARLSLVNNELTKPVFDLAKGKSLIEAQVDFAWDGATSSDIDITPVEYKDQDSSFRFEGATYQVNVNATMDDFDYEGQSNKINILGKDQVEVTIPGVTFSGHQKKTSFDYMTGEQQVNFENISVSNRGKSVAELKGLSFSANAELSTDNKKLNAKGEYTLASLSALGQDFGGGKISVTLASLDAAAFSDFMKNYRQFGKELLADTPEQQEDPDYLREKIETQLFPHVMKLKKGEPEVKWLVSWKNGKGESTINLDMKIADMDKALDASASETAVLDNQVKYINAKLVVPVDMAIEVGKNVMIAANHKSEESAKSQATQAVNGLVGLGNMFKLITMENNTVKMDVQYSQGYITLNGKKMTLDEFRQQYGQLGIPH